MAIEEAFVRHLIRSHEYANRVMVYGVCFGGDEKCTPAQLHVEEHNAQPWFHTHEELGGDMAVVDATERFNALKKAVESAGFVVEEGGPFYLSDGSTSRFRLTDVGVSKPTDVSTTTEPE